MIKDFFKKIVENNFFISSKQKIEDVYSAKNGLGIQGEVFWTLHNTDTGVIERGHIRNTVTFDASILVARLMKGTGTATTHLCEPNFGIYALAVGTGDTGWDLQNPPVATKSQRSLFNELSRKAIASTSFIDGDGAISAVPTNIVDFTATFSESEGVGPLTEMGLIGGDISTIMSNQNPVLPPNGPYDATVSLIGLDTQVNYLTFPVINKPATSTLELTFRLTF